MPPLRSTRDSDESRCVPVLELSKSINHLNPLENVRNIIERRIWLVPTRHAHLLTIKLIMKVDNSIVTGIMQRRIEKQRGLHKIRYSNYFPKQKHRVLCYC